MDMLRPQNPALSPAPFAAARTPSPAALAGPGLSEILDKTMGVKGHVLENSCHIVPRGTPKFDSQVGLVH